MKRKVELWVNAYKSAFIPGAIILGMTYQTREEALEYRNEEGTPLGEPIKFVHEWEEPTKCDLDHIAHEERLEDARQERLEVMREKGENP